MAERGLQEVIESGRIMNGYHATNGISQAKSPLPKANGNVNAAKIEGVSAPPASSKSNDQSLVAMNGITSSPGPLQAPAPILKMDQLPEEIQELLNRDTMSTKHYVPIAQLVDRVTRSCWTDLLNVLNHLAKVRVPEATNVTDRLPGEPDAANDVSEANRSKKINLWDFAENYKRELIKVLVLMQWSSKTEENRHTIALNVHLVEQRAAFQRVNGVLAGLLAFLPQNLMDAAPDLDTAAEILSAGRMAELPDLGYSEEQQMSDKQMLSTIQRLNSILSLRMTSEDDLPVPLQSWQIHDGRVTFTVPQEFDLSLSVMDVEVDAKFLTVDVKFNFWPAPTFSQNLLDEILLVTNSQLHDKGLEGAYRFLHDLSLTQKLKEFQRQAITLAQGLWAGHIGIEMLKRTLIVQYWTRRPASKSWIEITINSGRRNAQGELVDYPVPHLDLRWMRHGKLVADHNIEIDLVHLSFENILNQVIAHHATSMLDDIYDRLAATKLYANNELEIEEKFSVTDAHECWVDLQLSQVDRIQLACDPVAGTMIISPANERTSRLQFELARSKNLIDDFVGRFAALRCSIAQATLTKAISTSSWQNLPGLKPSLAEVKELFPISTLRGGFFKQADWEDGWTLAASFGSDGDEWWLVHGEASARRVVQSLGLSAMHLQKSYKFGYFEQVAERAASMVTLQVNEQASRKLGLKSILSRTSPAKQSSLNVRLSDEMKLSSIAQDIVITSCSSKRATSKWSLIVEAHLQASEEILLRLASAELDSSIHVKVGKHQLRLQLDCNVGETVIETAIARLRYVDDLINCMKLVHVSSMLKLQSLSLDRITIDYHTSAKSTLSLALLLPNADNSSLVRLLPEGNPHKLLSGYVELTLVDNREPLSTRLKALLAILRMSLPLVNCLQYMQGLVSAEEAPEMASLDLVKSRKWLRIHCMARGLHKLGVHFFATNAAFKHDVHDSETPEKMLVRLEIEPLASGTGTKLCWVVRPAIEEFRSYTRPSFTSDALRERLEEKIWKAKNSRWVGMTHSAKCLFDEPHHLVIALHDTILEWLEEAVAEHARKPAPTQPVAAPNGTSTPVPNGVVANRQSSSQPPSAQKRQNPQNQNMPNKQQMAQAQAMQNRQQQMQQSQNQTQANSQHFQQHNRPPNMNMPQNTNGTSRVMTAPPQQVRPPANTQQRRQGGNQNMQNRGQNQNQNQQRPNPRDVINLD